MDILLSILLIILGVIIFFITYKDGRKRKMELTTSYIMHLQGYTGGIVIILIGIIILFRNLQF